MGLFNKKYTYVLPLLAICSVIFCAPAVVRYSGDVHNQLANSDQTALCLPFNNIRIDYIDNTNLKPDSRYTGSFFIEAANGFLMFEVTRKFRLASGRPTPADSTEKIEKPAYSILANDTTLRRVTSKRVRDVAEKYSADLVVVPYACVIKQSMVRTKSWRNNAGPGYERPVSFSAATAVHVQIWNKNGQLLYECIGKSDTGRPILYSLLKKKKPDADIVKFAKRMYAPPLIKSLYASIKNAMGR